MLTLNARGSVLEMTKELKRNKTLGRREPSPVSKSEDLNGKKILVINQEKKNLNENQTGVSHPLKSLKDP